MLTHHDLLFGLGLPGLVGAVLFLLARAMSIHSVRCGGNRLPAEPTRPATAQRAGRDASPFALVLGYLLAENVLLGRPAFPPTEPLPGVPPTACTAPMAYEPFCMTPKLLPTRPPAKLAPPTAPVTPVPPVPPNALPAVLLALPPLPGVPAVPPVTPIDVTLPKAYDAVMEPVLIQPANPPV